MKLHISEELSLPMDVVTQTIAILAKRRAGKSYTMRRLAEQLFKAGQQIVMVDPKGDQWGIRSSADGKLPGLPVIILGGERGDVPLESSSGEIVAKLVVEQRVSALLDLSLFRKHEVATFMTAFMENLYRLKAREVYRTPMMLVIDEADAIAPQKPQKGEERMLGAAEDIVRRGGQRGIGCVLVTQRSAVLNKNVLTQSQIMVALRTIAPQDLDAMDAWIQVHGEPEQRKMLMESLPSLPIGDAWFWSPGWPTIDGIFKRVHVLPIETFDSGATPKPGVKPVEPKQLADVDLDALKEQMASTIQKAKDNDPAELKRTIADLKRKLEKAEQSAPKVEQTRIPILDEESMVILSRLEKSISHSVIGITDYRTVIESAIAHVRHIDDRLKSLLDTKPKIVPAGLPRVERIYREKPQEHSNGEVSGGMRRMMIALAQRPGLTKIQLGIRVGLSSGSGTFSQYLSRLRSANHITANEPFSLTQDGLAALGHYDPLPTGRELLRYWLNYCGNGGMGRMLSALADVYPDTLTKEELGERAGISSSSGTFSQYLSRLRKLEITDGMALRANPELFE